MQIAVLSGKGGTGKTSFSTNLAVLSPRTLLLDCDVEEPNAHLFIKPEKEEQEIVSKRYPRFREEACLHCRRCSGFCRFHAILGTSTATISMKELCHDCGGCALVCPENAIVYEERRIGRIAGGYGKGGSRLLYGVLDPGEYSGVRLIQALKQKGGSAEESLVDCPPGTGCSTVSALEGCDYAVIVTEPTPFALSDMNMAVKMIREIKIPSGIVINKAGIGDRKVYEYCRTENLPILGEIPFSLEAARCYAAGELAVEHLPEFRRHYMALRTSLREAVQNLCT